jgi:ATP-binding cassette subfamily C (CFTR/MRP) protein 4
MQDCALFDGTLRFNLDPAGKFSDVHIWDCLRTTNLTDFVQQFAPGLDFVIDSDGAGLSEGERQMICCIRGLLSKLYPVRTTCISVTFYISFG